MHLRTTNLARALDFYQRVIGLKLVERADSGASLSAYRGPPSLADPHGRPKCRSASAARDRAVSSRDPFSHPTRSGARASAARGGGISHHRRVRPRHWRVSSSGRSGRKTAWNCIMTGRVPSGRCAMASFKWSRSRSRSAACWQRPTANQSRRTRLPNGHRSPQSARRRPEGS